MRTVLKPHRSGVDLTAPPATNRVSRPTLFRVGLVCGLLSTGVAMAGPLGLFGPKGDTNDAQRQTVQTDSDAMLAELYRTKPELKDRIKNAAGYATFKRTNVNLLLVASGNGYGMLVDNKTGKKTYMRVASLGGGVGMGINDLRVIFIFNDASVMKTFLDQGWQFGGSADATAKHEDTGVTAGQTVKANVDFKEGTVSGAASTDAAAGAGKDMKADANVGLGGAMEIYQFTKSGISLQATVSGTKFWKDTDLN